MRQEATLTLADGGCVEARVTRVSDEEVVLVLLLPAGAPAPAAGLDPLQLEFATARGLVRLAGAGRRLGHDAVALLLDGAVDVIQRRDFVRVRAVRPLALAVVCGDGETGPWIDTMVVDVSGNGLLASGPDTLAVGARVRFRMRLAEGEPPLEGVGSVSRVSDAGHRGIAIEELAEDARRRLVAFIFERERIARKVTRDSEL